MKENKRCKEEVFGKTGNTPVWPETQKLREMAEEELQRMEFQLSDFAFFLSVMKNRQAYKNVLEIIMDEKIDLEEVKVEEVILNQKGKRAIRLDAWARSSDERQFAIEMQNDTERDDVRRRSRYYQGLIDSPILKAGKRTLYRMLPATVIIFITQEDIFGRDRAMYTFTERCSEEMSLELSDGTTKIFLNMSSKNGRKELVSLLQYMKESNLQNPAIEEKSARLVELDRIVQEVKNSQEWEETRMSILSVGLARGEEIGMKIGIEKGIEKGIEQGRN